MQSIDPRGNENIQRASRTSARAQTTEIQAPRISTTRADLPLRLPAQPLNPSTQTTFGDINEDTSDLDFDLDSLPYSKPESHTKARLIIEDFLDIKTSIIQIKEEHQWTWEEQRAQQAAIEGFDSRWNEVTIARLNRQTEEVAKIQGKQVERFPQSGLIRLTKVIDEPLPSTPNSPRQSLRKEENEELQKQILRNEELQRRNNAIARDLDDLRNLTITKDAQQRKERIEEATRHKEELKAARQSSSRRSSRDSLPSPVPLLLQPAILSPKEYAKEYNDPQIQEKFSSYQRQRKDLRFGSQQDQGNGYRQGRAQGYEQKREQAPANDLSDPDSSDGDPEGGNRRGNEWDRHGRKGGGHGGPTKGQGNEPPRDPGRDPGRGYEPPGGPGPNRPPTSTPFSTRVLARHTYGTPAPDDDDFPELGTADPHPKAKELALFAKSFPKELKYSRPKNDFNTRLKIFADHACRYGLTTDDYLAAFPIMLAEEAIGFYYNYVIKAQLPTFKENAIAIKDYFKTEHRRQAKYDRLKDDKSLADKLYSACKNVPETTIARMNPASTSTAAIADIRRAIGFATESIQPLKTSHLISLSTLLSTPFSTLFSTPLSILLSTLLRPPFSKPQARLIPTTLRTSTSVLFKAANTEESTISTSQDDGKESALLKQKQEQQATIEYFYHRVFCNCKYFDDVTTFTNYYERSLPAIQHKRKRLASLA
ncbi:hypothetical protein MBM_02670 [Drepanopeziza brunnea f. sp. 'multigermtubi' MB_m1]|uniref:Uncharacterized protein n=1 Tax=Marssonina brunnea f. sp. multigermtubi (strain MB_m1) TaxID=1072389 RepID=K1XEU9_MARBU|nr:uncharacterized protein MBM_02670 [Drepanopeziza brunnea f. sp. 'multigermtubi' MB_m1]EKD19433.1 hypothetical protein MBM_02670 [Drepanopeziza brunnea f. sp. 'multigermtubi' MB_m1]